MAPSAAMCLISSSWVPWQVEGRETSSMSLCVHVCLWGGLENWLWVYISMCAWSVANYGWACAAQQFPEAGSSTKPVERLALHSSLVSSAKENPEPVCVCMSVRCRGRRICGGEDYHLVAPPHLFIPIEGGTSGSRFGIELI